MFSRRTRTPLLLSAFTCWSAVACSKGAPAPAPTVSAASPAQEVREKTVYDFEAKTIEGRPIKLSEYRGKVLLIVNVASGCGFTPQYEGLESSYRKYKDAGLVVLGFPCDQFGHQEPGTEDEIKSFCASKFDVTFSLFSKIEVNGPNALPLYQFLRAKQKGGLSKDMPGAERLYSHLEKTQPEVFGTDAVKWNFTKFLVGRDGKVLRRFESPETPQAIEPAIVAALDAKP